MLRYIGVIILTLVFVQGGFSQEVSGFHDIQPGSAPNEYNIKTTIKGLVGVDIARIKYIISNKHTYKASPNNALFSDRNESYIKFYIMAVPASGVLNVELGIVLADDAEHAFPVEFQYSKNEEKQTVNLPQVNFSGNGEIVAVLEAPEPVAPVEEEIPEVIVEEVPAVEEIPEVVEVPEPVEPVVEETPEPSEPVAEEIPEPIETPEPVAPVVEEVPEPVAPVIEEEPESAPVVEEVPEVEETPPPVEVSRVAVKYTVQILSLAEFSQIRLNTYCRQHNLSINDVKKKQVGEWMKITYGEANSIQEATQLKEKLMRENSINEAFVTPIK